MKYSPLSYHVGVVHQAVHPHGELGNVAVLDAANARTVGDGQVPEGAHHVAAIRVAAVENHGQEWGL